MAAKQKLSLDEFINNIGTISTEPMGKLQSKKVRVYEQMITHTRGLKPHELIDSQRPNEPEEIKNYRLSNFEPITQQGIIKAIDRLYRSMDNSNYQVKLSQNIKDYIADHEFSFMDNSGPSESMEFMQIVTRHILQSNVEDPNGLLVWMPQTPDDAEIGTMPSNYTGSSPIDVAPYYVPSNMVLENNNIFTAFKSNIIHYWKQDDLMYEFPYIYLIDINGIIRFTPVERLSNKEYRFEQELYYSFNGEDSNLVYFEMKPVIELGGILTSYKGDNGTTSYYYDSFLQPYNALANEAIRAFTDDQAVRVQNAFPIKSVKGDPCESCHSTGYTEDEHGQRHTCRTCGGSGYIAAISPYKVYIKKPGNVSEPESYTNSAAVEFYSPSVDILAHTDKTWKNFLALAERAVNVAFIDEAQSGTAKEIDRDQLKDMQLKVSGNIFRIIKKSLDIIESYRVPFVNDREYNYVMPPTQFKNKTQAELIEELTELKTKGAPSAFILESSKELAKKLYGDDPVKNKMWDVMVSYDILFPFTVQEVGIMKSQGLPAEVVVKHQYVYSKLQQIAGTDEELFMDASMPDIIAELDTLILPLVPSGSGRVDDILMTL